MRCKAVEGVRGVQSSVRTAAEREHESIPTSRDGYVKGLCCKETKEFCGKGVERRIVRVVRTKESWKARRRSDVGKGNKEAT